MPNLIKKLYKENLALLTDLYQLTMANGYWKNGLYNREAVFHLFYRKNPFKGNYALACGLQQVIEYLEDFQFSMSDIQYLGSLKGSDGAALFDEGFLNHLQRMKFSCDIEAIPEGTIVFPNQPLIRVKGPLLQAQLIETAILNIINFQTLIATKASRICSAAEGESVLEFGLRRAQGIDGGISASRAAFVGGCDATSNVLAGKLFGIPVKGTHAHSWVMCFDEELESFAAYAKAMPNNCIFLVDTYDTVEGVKNAIQIGKQLANQGQKLLGIRLDSGDLAALSIKARKLLDEAGMTDTKIVASNDLEEYKIKKLKEEGAQITVWGVGTRLVTASDQPALGGVYKLAAIKNKNGAWEDRIKLSENAIKVSNPSIQQVKRISIDSIPKADLIYEADTDVKDQFELMTANETVHHFTTKEVEDLLVPILRKGALVYSLPSLTDIREKALSQLKLFSETDLANYPNGLEISLYEKKMQLIKIHQLNSKTILK